MDYRQDRMGAWGAAYPAASTATERLGYLKKVYGLFTASILLSAAGAMVALNVGAEASRLAIRVGGSRVVVPPLVALFGEHPFISFIVAMGVVFGASAVRHVRGLNVAALFGMATLLGLIFAPALFYAQLSARIGGTLSASPVRDAFLLSVFAFGGLTAFAVFSKRDFSYLGGALTMGLFVVIGASLLNFFFASTAFSLAISSVAVLLFGGYILYDTSRLLRSEERDPVGGAICLYLDFVNLFLAILRILSARRD